MKKIQIRDIKKFIETNDKNKDLIVNVLGAFLVKGGAVVVSFISLPMYIKYFDNQSALGVWYTILSLVTWILSFDLGVGNGLRNKIVGPIEKKNRGLVKSYVSSSYFIFSIIIICIGGLGIYFVRYVHWNIFFNIDSTVVSGSILLKSIRLILLGLMFQFILQLINSILYALQKSLINNVLALITNIMQLIFVSFAPIGKVETNLINMSYMYIFSVNVPLLAITIWVFTKKLKGCMPSLHYVKYNLIKEVLSVGNIFFIAQIEYMVIVVTTEFLISNLVAPEYVVSYQAYNKIFSLPGTLLTLALTPVWSAVTRAMVQNDYKWIIKIFNILKKAIIIIFAVELAIVPIFQFVLNIWIKNSNIEINYILMILFSIFYTLIAANTVFSTFACGLGRLKVQVICYAVGIIMKFVLAYTLINIVESWGVIIIANIVALLPYVSIQPYFLKRDLKHT